MRIPTACLVLASLTGVFGQPNITPKPNKQLKPTFSWLSERSESGIPHLSIKTDGGEDLVAVLAPYNPIPIEADSSRSAVDPCIFKGHLANEDDAQVLVTGGCPGDDSFEIAMISKQFEGFRFQVKNGKAEQTRSLLGTPEMKSDGTMGIFRDLAVKSHQFPTQRNASLNRVALPAAGFIFRLAIIYDTSYLQKYVTQTEAVNAARRQMANAQLIFKWPTLTVPITLEVVSITYQNIAIPADGSGLAALIPFATDSSLGSYVGLTSTGPYGGIAYQPGVCGTLRYRTAVVQSGVGWSDQDVAETMAHELGHNLGMNHDFIDPYTSPKTIFRDSAGNTCTDVNGVMDYYVTVQKWTTCSVERFTQHYNNVVNSAGSFCLPVNSGTTLVNGNWGAWSAFGTCSATCGGGSQARTRSCNNPAPANGGAACVGSATESQACNTQSCTPSIVNGNWGAWSAFGTCSATCGGGSQARTRSCNNPAPANGGAACVGSATESQACNTQVCTASRAVYLVGGPTPNAGTVYATNPVTGIAGPVCDDYFDQNAGNVICKQLGFPLGAQSVYCCSNYGAVPTNFSYDNVQCAGTETTLNACPHLNAHDCGSTEGAGVVCRTGTTTAAVALVGGTSSSQGVLYATNPVTGNYGPVCDDYFTLASANVVCKQLKFSAATSVACCSSNGAVPTNFSYDNVQCSGTEATLDACPHLNAHDCGASEGLWIVCNSSG